VVIREGKPTATNDLEHTMDEELPYAKHELVGIEEIAQLGFTDVGTAREWAKLESFPAPLARLKTGDLWDRGVVYKWLLENGKRGVPPTVGS
jgi:hypothetical protein